MSGNPKVPPVAEPESPIWDEDDPVGWMRAERIKELDQLHRQMLVSKNPLYAWDAIRHCHHPTYPLPYPEWCRDYLNRTAIELHVLGRLLDPNKYPDRRDDETDDEHRRRWEAWQSGPKITPDKARNLTARALGLIRNGWNAYQRFHADAATRSDALDYEFPVGMTRREVLESKLNPDGNLDDRNARRRISHGRSLLDRPRLTRTRAKPTP